MQPGPQLEDICVNPTVQSLADIVYIMPRGPLLSLPFSYVLALSYPPDFNISVN